MLYTTMLLAEQARVKSCYFGNNEGTVESYIRKAILEWELSIDLPKSEVPVVQLRELGYEIKESIYRWNFYNISRE